jgi:PKHD-type hydroxylase
LVEHLYYPLTKPLYQPVITLEGYINRDDVDNVLNLVKEETIVAALVGATESDSEEQFEKDRLQAHSIRKSNVSFLYGSKWEWLYEKLTHAVAAANNMNYSKTLYGISPLQYSEYDSLYAGFYGPHSDCIMDMRNGLRRSLSFSVQLSESDSYDGGELKVYENNTIYTANKNIGSISFFDSSALHEVTPVTAGFRKSLVGWVLGPRV